MRVLLALAFSARAFAGEPAPLHSGDLIFHSSKSKQGYAIMWASKSLFNHVGIIEREGGKYYVLEAISKVSRTPLDEWIERGRLGRYLIRRLKGTTPEHGMAIVAAAKKHLGRGYDIYFTSNNTEIYCSELVHMAYTAAGLHVGRFQKVNTLDVNNLAVRKLFKSRWKKHPLCQEGTPGLEECWKRVLDDELITPDSLAQDPNTEQIYSNYP